MDWGDVVPVLTLAGCVLAAHSDRKNPDGSTLVAFLIGCLAWFWIAATLAGDIFGDTVSPALVTPEHERGVVLRLVAFVGVVIWGLVVLNDGAPASSPTTSVRSPRTTPRAPSSGLTTADGVQVGVGSLVWSENHWPWVIVSVDAGWVHFEHDWDNSEQQSGMIAVEDFARYYYRHHPSGPMTCYTAGCRHRPWGVR